MKTWIERALNIHPGDLGRGTLLCAWLFLVITSYVIGKVAAAALFLSRFQAKQLAYADISSSVLVALVVAGYVVIARRVHLRTLLVGSLLFFASNCAVFWGLAHYHSHLAWLFPAFYIWVKIFGVLGANPDLDAGELRPYHARSQARFWDGGRRSQSRVGSLPAIFSKAIAKTFGTESLLLGMALFLLICAGLVIVDLAQRASARSAAWT